MPVSKILPAYITITRSVMPATTPRSWVMSMIGHAVSLLELGEQIEDLRLNRHVERRRRLVGDEEFGLARQRHRDHHALAHPAGELVRDSRARAARASGMPTSVEHADAVLARLRRQWPSGAAVASVSWRRPGRTGLSESSGPGRSWRSGVPHAPAGASSDAQQSPHRRTRSPDAIRPGGAARAAGWRGRDRSCRIPTPPRSRASRRARQSKLTPSTARAVPSS
jgi:hypothetical protein